MYIILSNYYSNSRFDFEDPYFLGQVLSVHEIGPIYFPTICDPSPVMELVCRSLSPSPLKEPHHYQLPRLNLANGMASLSSPLPQLCRIKLLLPTSHHFGRRRRINHCSRLEDRRFNGKEMMIM